MRYKLKIHTAYNQIQRETYLVLDFLGDIGGFLSLLQMVGSIIVQGMALFILKSKIFSKIYLQGKLGQSGKSALKSPASKEMDKERFSSEMGRADPKETQEKSKLNYEPIDNEKPEKEHSSILNSNN